MRLKTISAIFACLVVLAGVAKTQSTAPATKSSPKPELVQAKANAESKPAPAASKASAPALKPAPPAPSDKDLLESVLKKMDAAAANFRTTQADFEWDQFTRVIGSTDTQTGKIYFRRNGKTIEML